MPRPSARQPRQVRAVLSLSIPIDPDYTRASRAASMRGESLSAWIREAMRQRANRQLGKDGPDLSIDEPGESPSASDDSLTAAVA